VVCNVAFSTAAPTISPEVRQLWNSCRNSESSKSNFSKINFFIHVVAASDEQFERIHIGDITVTVFRDCCELARACLCSATFFAIALLTDNAEGRSFSTRLHIQLSDVTHSHLHGASQSYIFKFLSLGTKPALVGAT
jgi:hypothetical protein